MGKSALLVASVDFTGLMPIYLLKLPQVHGAGFPRSPLCVYMASDDGWWNEVGGEQERDSIHSSTIISLPGGDRE